MQQFQHTYHLEIEVHCMPGDTLLGRLERECQRLTPAVIAVNKIKSLFVASRPQNDKTIQLGDQVCLKLYQEEQVPVRSVLAYYPALRILACGYAIVGQHKTQSTADPSKEVIFAPLSDKPSLPRHRICCTALADMAPSALLDFVDCARARMIELIRTRHPPR